MAICDCLETVLQQQENTEEKLVGTVVNRLATAA